MTARPAVLAAASPWVREQLAGPVRPAQVIHAGAQAVYVDVDDTVLAVVARDGVRVPCGAHTPLPALHDLDGSGGIPRAGQSAYVGHDELRIGDGVVRVARTVDAQLPAVDPADAPTMLARLAAASFDVGEELPAEALATLGGASPADAVLPLLGRGSGLTPLGDDVLCGWIATMVAAADPCVVAVADAVTAHAPHRTTALSATLLRRATTGAVIPEFVRAVRQLRRPDGPAEPHALAALTGVGHTSGTGMLLGLMLALDHLASRSCP